MQGTGNMLQQKTRTNVGLTSCDSLLSRINVLAACFPVTDSNWLVYCPVFQFTEGGPSPVPVTSLFLLVPSTLSDACGTQSCSIGKLRIKYLEHVTNALYLNISKKLTICFLETLCVYFYCSTVARKTLSSSQAILNKMTRKCLYSFRKADTHFRQPAGYHSDIYFPLFP